MYDDFINHAQLQHILLEDVFLSDTKGLDKKADARLRFPGFPIMERPSLSTVSFMKKEKNTIPRTTVEFMYIKLNHQSQCSLDALAKNILTKTVYINWPYLQEAYAVGVTDFKNKIILKDYWKKYAEDNITLSNPTLNVVQSLKNDCDSITEKYKNNMGIDIGETKQETGGSLSWKLILTKR
ncbi:uncharacterized protein LOC111643327 [Copidosoma floridanum]|uniref:uncharacterized protein LOC111643327 n=1 Tax=Copidosoma floridanum TaxID=29053 RepID=UPI000C6F88E1|nr:uncharacterized protein LOC111643327 [Copidosoma floridanum]